MRVESTGIGRIRMRWLASLSALAFVPLVVVALSVPYQLFVEASLMAAASRAVEKIQAGESATRVAARHNVRIRLIDTLGATQHGEAAMSRWTNHVARRFVDRASRDRIRRFDARPPRVGPNEVGSGCAVVADGSLLTCHAAVRAPDGLLIVAEAASIRTISTLYGHRAPLLAVVLHVLVFALGLGVWLGRRTVRPIDRLRDAVRHRTGASVGTTPIPVEGSDEIAELAHAFNDLLATVESQREATLDFVSEVAHELKTPVSTIQQFADLARSIDEPRLRRPVHVLEQSCERMHLRIEELLELARAAAGLPGTERTTIHLAALVQQLVRTHAAREAVHVRCDEVCVRGNARYLEIAVRNVLDNAVQYARAAVEVNVVRRGAVAVISVRDDGPGIPASEREVVFERFRTRRRDGTGLGLSMTRAVLRAHGGDARVLACDDGALLELWMPCGDRG